MYDSAEILAYIKHSFGRNRTDAERNKLFFVDVSDVALATGQSDENTKEDIEMLINEGSLIGSIATNDSRSIYFVVYEEIANNSIL